MSGEQAIQSEWLISKQKNGINIKAGLIQRTLDIATLENDNFSIKTTSIKVDNKHLLESPSADLCVSFYLANPNERPKGISLETESGIIEQESSEIKGSDGLKVKYTANLEEEQEIQWIKRIEHDNGLNNIFRDINVKLEPFQQNRQRISITLGNSKENRKKNYLQGVSVEINYEIYAFHPAIRKWIVIKNEGNNWVKIDNLILDRISLKKEYHKNNNFTPSERGACASIIGKQNKHKTHGIILASEIPSVLRTIENNGTMAYTQKYFEWVLGPNEEFESEPIFHYAFMGKRTKTISAVSLPIDRCIEGEFKRFLENVVGIRAKPEKLPHPLWCTWSNFVANINDENIRDMADIASQCGFGCMQIDAGWAKSQGMSSWSAGSAEPHPVKFAKFKGTCDYIKSKGLNLGLWLSCFRELGTKDLIEMPNARSLPLVKRKFGFGMSYASDWRYYYADDVVRLIREYGATYFKQDLTNIKYGDIAEGHDSRTKK
ncbi:MAG: hypothetical protein GF364_02430, partial [Candidatus Lokiarchaeota archaeon]|nr:hypothetical protein [Candidatus Lokiarchaeota archaeon]